MTPEQIKAAIDEMNRTFNTLQERVTAAEQRGAQSVDEGEVTKLQNKLDELELKLKRPGFDPGDAAQHGKAGDRSPEAKAQIAAAVKLCRFGEDRLQPEERKLLTLANDETGGILASPELDREILKVEAEISDVEPAIRVRTTSKRSVHQPKRTGTFAAQWVNEVGTRSETKGLKYNMTELPNHEIYALVAVSRQDLEDSDYDLEAQIVEEASEQFAIAFGSAVVNGGANGEMEGILTNADVVSVPSGDANLVTYDGLVTLSHEGNSNYMKRGEFWFRLATLGKLRILKDDNKLPIFAPMKDGAPSTILGRPYRIIPDMPAVAANAFPIVYGDFKKGYTAVRRISQQIIRDHLTRKNEGVVEIQLFRRLGGKVVIAEAIRKLKIATS